MTSRRNHTRVTGFGVHTLLISISFLILLPLVWTLKSSFTPTGEVMSSGLFHLPSQLTGKNYSEGVASAPFLSYFANSLLVAITVTTTTLVASLTAGYGFAHFNFRGKGILFALVLAGMMMPFQAIMIPLFVEVRKLGWLDNFAGLIIPGAVSAFGIFMMRQYLRSIPVALFEAAKLDGASEFGIFWRIVIPLSTGPLAALGSLTFLASWNNFLWPLIVVQGQNLITVPLGLAQFRGSNSTNYGQMLAVSILSALPVVTLFMIMRRRIVASFATSGIK
ncbi:MAG: carbohydrate ABC transporter permease [Candidatus Nanopelagicaceae bacterium]|nr:carbohydrate ABC transporter permease [Candidatus Nanopelagicaceae bacterium]